MRRITILIFGFLLLLAGACSVQPTASPSEPTDYATPTLHNLFVSDGKRVTQEIMQTDLPVLTPTIADLFSKKQTPTPEVTQTLELTPTPTETVIVPTDTLTVTIYSDYFNPNWDFRTEGQLEVNTEAKVPVKEGNHSIAITPQQGGTKVSFVVKKDTDVIFPRSQVLGFRFWINPGDGVLTPADLAISAIGSNEYPYYVEGDKSVTNTVEPVFSETRLYYLEFNRSVPTQTWAEVILWLDELIYDPDYEYVVGFTIKNDPAFIQTFYIDDVRMIVDASEPLPRIEKPEDKDAVIIE